MASPSAPRLTSTRVPWRANAGRVAVTMTAATFLVRNVLEMSRVLTPSRSSMPIRLCCVNGRVIDRVAGAVEADHQAVAHQHIAADAFEIGDVLDAGLGGDRAGGHKGQRDGRTGGQATAAQGEGGGGTS